MNPKTTIVKKRLIDGVMMQEVEQPPATDDKQEEWSRIGCEIIRQGLVIFTCDTEADAVHAEEMHNAAISAQLSRRKNKYKT